MKNVFFQLLICIGFASCSQPSKYEGPIIAPSKITKDLMSWLYYQRDYMVWSSNYETLDAASRAITKDEFLQQLTSGNYLPLRIHTRDSSLCYQLYKLDDAVDEEIVNTIRNKAQQVYQYFKMEGQKLPGFHFVDLDGNIYDSNTTKGKIVVLNCWFIRCKPCNEEMPRLNQLVEQFENRKDIVFLGLAFDEAEALKKFLKKTVFKYAIVPGKENYLMNNLRISGYPTHLIINKQGIIEKVIEGNVNEFIGELNKVVM